MSVNSVRPERRPGLGSALLCARRGFIWGYKQSNLISASSVVSRPSVITWIRAEETGLEGLSSIDPRRSNVS